ncbi:MAG: transposase [Brasilonema angustatum HA4187-MV1]|nr:transposase [Brasilonema angustatum HA4187-MV1]
MIQWFDEIFAYFGKITTNAVVEDLKNKLKLIKRSAYVFSTFQKY